MAVEKPVKTDSGRYRARYKDPQGHRRYAGIHDTATKARAAALTEYAWHLAGEPRPLRKAGRPVKASETLQEPISSPYPYEMPSYIEELDSGRYRAFWRIDGELTNLGIYNSVEEAFDSQRPWRIIELKKRPDWALLSLARTDPDRLIKLFEDAFTQDISYVAEIATASRELSSDVSIAVTPGEVE